MSNNSKYVLEMKTVQIAPVRTLMTALKDILLETNIIFPLVLKNEKTNDIVQALRELLPWLSLERVIKQKVCNLSIAELKLAQFARAIIGRPRILLLDNFFKDVDSEIQKKINYLILALKKIGTTVIVFVASPDDSFIDFNKRNNIIC